MGRQGSSSSELHLSELLEAAGGDFEDAMECRRASVDALLSEQAAVAAVAATRVL